MTAISRAGSKSTLPAGIKKAEVDYDDESSIVAALKGQQFVAITLSIFAAEDTHSKIVKAAAKAGVPYIMPNIYGGDFRNKALFQDALHGKAFEMIADIEASGSDYIGLVCGFWYEWSLALGEPWYGFDIKNKKATFIDEGTVKINTSTWDQCGRALAGLLSLPESGASPCVADWKNKPVYIKSFRVSQRDMLDSLNRVMGTSDKDWTIAHEPSGDRYKRGLEEMKAGNRAGFATAMYTRNFFPHDSGDYEKTTGVVNDVLGLPKEDLDESTKRAVEMVESGYNPFA